PDNFASRADPQASRRRVDRPESVATRLAWFAWSPGVGPFAKRSSSWQPRPDRRQIIATIHPVIAAKRHRQPVLLLTTTSPHRGPERPTRHHRELQPTVIV